MLRRTKVSIASITLVALGAIGGVVAMRCQRDPPISQSVQEVVAGLDARSVAFTAGIGGNEDQWSLEELDDCLSRGSAQAGMERIVRVGSGAIGAMKAIIDTGDVPARLVVAEALGRICGEEAVDVLEALSRDPHTGVRHVVLRSLGRAGTPRCAQIVLEMLSDPSTGIRVGAIHCLGGIRGQIAFEGLGRLVTHDDPKIRATAIAVLGLRWKQEAMVFLRETPWDKDSWVRYIGIRAIGQIGGDEAARILQAKLSDDHDVDTVEVYHESDARHVDKRRIRIRAAVIEELARIGAPTVVDALIAQTQKGEEECRSAAWASLAKVGGSKAIEFIRGSLESKDPDTRAFAAWALAASSAPDGQALLQAMLAKETEPKIRRQIEAALERVRPPK